MELLQLHYFQITARYEHISAAARELGIAQPALSQTIRRLEQELGTPLFDRIGKHIQLNDCGRIFLKYTNTALGALADARAEIARELGQPRQTVTLCVQAASSLLPDILGKFRTLHPHISFQIIQSTTTTETMADIDLTIRAVPRYLENSSSGRPQSGEDFCVLLTEPLVIALPDSHPLAKNETLRLQDLSDQPFASLYKNSNLFRITRYYCHLAGFEPKISLSCDNPQAFRELLGLNMGIAMIPQITWPGMESYGIITRPLSGMSCTRDILLSWNKNRYLCTGAVMMRDFLKDYFSKLNRSAPKAAEAALLSN